MRAVAISAFVGMIVGFIVATALKAPIEFEAKINISTLIGTGTTVLLAFAIPVWLQRALSRRTLLGGALLEPFAEAWVQLRGINALVANTESNKGLSESQQRKDVIAVFRQVANALQLGGQTLKSIKAPRSVQKRFEALETAVRGYKGAVTGEGMPVAKAYRPPPSQRSEIEKTFGEVSRTYHLILTALHNY